MDFDLLLADRIGVIKDIIRKYGQDSFYLSFSGGKDSTVLHYLLDMALPNNNIPRVFANTGIEYPMLVDYVNNMAKEDLRFNILRPVSPIKVVLENFGYPFKSKEFSKVYSVYQKYGFTGYVSNFIGENGYLYYHNVPSQLQEMFKHKVNIKISDLCCDKLKKDTLKNWSLQHGCNNVITGIRKSEGGRRSKTKGCITNFVDSVHFHPLLVCDDEFIEEFIKRYNIKLCALYYEPYNLKRTGCVGCPFNPFLQELLLMLKVQLPNLFKQCWYLWGDIYNLYLKYNYRLTDKNVTINS